MTKKKKIFVAVTNDIATDQRVDKVCRYLLGKNFSIQVYGRLLQNSYPIKRHYKVVRKKHIFNNNFLFYAEFNIRLFFYLLFKNYDYILSNDLDTLPACFFISRIKKSTLVYDSHELFSEGPELQGRKFVKGFWTKLEDFFLPKIQKSYTVSNSIAVYYGNKYSNSMGVIRNIPFKNSSFLEKKVSFPTDKKTILYQGVLNPGRGLKPMIKALHFIDDLDLVIIGYGKVTSELKDFVKKESLLKRVHFLGRIPKEELLNYTKTATLGMVLEEPLGKSFEYSLPNKLFDYIHAELPIVAGNLPEISKIINQYDVGVIVKNYEPITIAKVIKELLNDKELLLKIKKNQKNAKKDLCWEKEQIKLDNYFK